MFKNNVIKPKTCIIIIILNNDIQEQVKINPTSKEIWLNNFQHLQSKQSEMLIQKQVLQHVHKTASDTALKKKKWKKLYVSEEDGLNSESI